ncbi:MAG: DUF362 domain-containing protein [Clostridia bacterium]|nr:DUF362 domain-containing protein [Clostridia bacterium]
MESFKSVSLEKCTDYDEEKVYEALSASISRLGGISRFIKPGMRVALKPNLLLPQNPASCATTHPAVVAAAGRLVLEAGGEPVVVESPGGLYNKVVLKTLYKLCGIADACEKHGISLNYDTTVTRVTADCLGRTRSFNVLKPLVEADFIINISKMKTHGMMVFTGAVKNMFGSIAGAEKASYHMNMPDYRAFATNLIDICETVAPGLSIMDAIMAMEGNGPSAGTPRKIGALLVSESPYALDKAAHDIINLDTDDSYVLAEALERGINLKYEALGYPVSEFFCGDFVIPFRISSGKIKHNLLNSRFLTRYKSKPVVNNGICVGCGICRDNCPAQVIRMVDGRPHFDYTGCIRCYCCQELCPEHAIGIQDPLLIKLLSRKGTGK